MTRVSIILIAAAVLFHGEQAQGQGPSVHHVPVAEAIGGDNIEVVADVAKGWEATLVLRFRTPGEVEWRRVPFKRSSERTYRAEIEASDVVPPGLEYYIASFTPQTEVAHFATPASPHPIVVREPIEQVLERSDLQRYEGQKTRFQLAGDYVDFGRRTTDSGQAVDDRYYRLEIDFTYRLFKFPLRAFRLGFDRMLGDTPVTSRGVEDCPADCEKSAGFRAGGWAELRWRLTSFADFDSRVRIQATTDGFSIGGRGELRFGDETATHFSLGGEAIGEVGTTFFVKLGWDTVPRVPMAASVQLSDYPSAHRDHGVRLIYDVAYEASRNIRIGGRVSYQARDQNIGGVSGGLNAVLEF